MEHRGHALVYGGCGALGSGIISFFKSNEWWVGCVEIWRKPAIESAEELSCTSSTHLVKKEECEDEKHRNQNLNKDADINILVHFEKSLEKQEQEILHQLEGVLENAKLEAIICVAGGYDQGGIHKTVENLEILWKQNLWPSIISSSIAAKYLSNTGMLCLTGARTALEGTPDSISYGVVKAAVHQLTKSLASKNGELPEGSLCICLLPVTIDTMMNRQNMPNADISSWTPTKYITELLFKWSNGQERPKNGTLVQLVTQNFNTDVTYL